MNVLFFILGSIGASFILADSKIMEKPRKLAEKWTWLHTLMTCYQCNSFWIGMFFGFFMISSNPIYVIACGCAASFVTVIAAYLSNILEVIPMRILNSNCSKCKESNPINLPGALTNQVNELPSVNL